MRREVIKAVIALVLVGCVLAAAYLAVEYGIVVRDSGVSLRESRRVYREERRKQVPNRWKKVRAQREREAGRQQKEEEAPANAEKLSVKGRALNRRLEPLPGKKLLVRTEGNEPVALKRLGGWFKAKGIQGGRELKLSIQGESMESGPIPLGGSGGKVSINWILLPDAAGKIKFCSVVCARVGPFFRLGFEGKCQFPDGARIVLSLKKGERRWYGDETLVKDGKFKGMLQPVEKGYPSGIYTIVAQFNPLVQNAEFSEKWPQLSFTSTSREVLLGTRDEAKKELKKELELYKKLLVKGKRLRRAFVVLRNSALNAKGVPWEVKQQVRRRFKREEPLLQDHGKLDVDAWRFWLEERFLSEVREWKERLEQREVPVKAEFYTGARAYVKALREWMHIVSLYVYEVGGVPFNAEDLVHISLTPKEQELVIWDKILGLENELSRSLSELRAEREGADPFK